MPDFSCKSFKFCKEGEVKKRAPKAIPLLVMTPAPPEPAPEPPRPDSMNMTVRQIGNGFIVSEHGYKDGSSFDREYYSRKQPTFGSKRTRFATEQKGAPATPKKRETPPPVSELVDNEDFSKGVTAKELPTRLANRNRDKRLMKAKL